MPPLIKCMQLEVSYFPVVILGAGAAGLRAAFDLADLGLMPLLVEKDEKAGGRLLKLERWFTRDACGFCRLLDSERRPLIPSGEKDVICLRHGVARHDIPLWTASRVVSAEREGERMTLDIARGCGAGERVSCDAVIVATGLRDADLARLSHLKAGIDPDVVTAVEFEEMISRPSPKPVRRPSGGGPVRSVAFVGCAGSRDTDRPWCSSSCCGFLVKEIALLRQIDDTIRTFLFCMDLRLFGKGMFLYGEKALRGTRIVRAKAGSIQKKSSGALGIRAAADAGDQEVEVDLVVLSGGQAPSSEKLLELLGVETDAGGFPLQPADGGPVSTSNASVFVAGSCRSPGDIASSVMEGRAAAAAAFERISGKQGTDVQVKTGKGSILVVGGGIAGLSAAASASLAGHAVTLLEKEERAGGLVSKIRLDPAGRDVPAAAARLEEELSSKPEVTILRGAEALRIEGRAGRFSVKLSDRVLEGFEAVVVASGAREHADDRVDGAGILSLRQMEDLLVSGAVPEGDVVFIQCVGSREEPHPYCNRICCAKAARLASEVARGPNRRAWILYRDMMTPGLDETLYTEAREAGVLFVRFDPASPPSRRRSPEGTVAVAVEDGVLGRTIELAPGLVVLSSGIEAPGPSLAGLLVPVEEEGFAAEDDPRFRPCQTTRPGMYVAGNARAPSTSREAALSGVCAGMGASIMARAIRTAAYEVPPSRTRENLCTGCGQCVEVCPAGARRLEGAVGAVAAVLEPLCQACGLCEAACPSGAAKVYPGGPAV